MKNRSMKIISCMLEDYESVQDKNCLGKKLVEGDNGALFFEALSREDNPEDRLCIRALEDGDSIYDFCNDYEKYFGKITRERKS